MLLTQLSQCGCFTLAGDLSCLQVAAFGGEAMQELVRRLQQSQHQFSVPPIGPIGAYLRLTASQWGYAAECALGSTLSAFVCANAADAHRVQTMGLELRLRINCYTADFSHPRYR